MTYLGSSNVKWEPKTTATQDRIAYQIERIDYSIPKIFSGAVNLALHEEDDYKAWEVFDHARKWGLEEHQTFDADVFLNELEKLREMSRSAGMEKVVKELSESIDFMEQNFNDLQSVLDNFRRQKLFDSLRENWSAN
jgi:hypothetical protein